MRFFSGNARRSSRLAPVLCAIAVALGLGFPPGALADERPPEPAPSTLPDGLRGELSPGRPLDLILLVDASLDAATSTGTDVNGDGKVDPGKGIRLTKGVLPTVSFRTGEDSILAAEIYAARRIVASAIHEGTRIGVVLMAQPFDPHPCELVPEGPGAELLQPLTEDRTAVLAALDRIALRRAGGASNLAEGLRMSVSMLTGLPDMGAEARPDARRTVLFFGHRAPTFPFGSPYHTSPDDIALAERTAKVAATAGVRIEILTFGTGEGMVISSLARIAEITGGALTRVPDVRKAAFGVSPP